MKPQKDKDKTGQAADWSALPPPSLSGASLGIALSGGGGTAPLRPGAGLTKSATSAPPAPPRSTRTGGVYSTANGRAPSGADGQQVAQWLAEYVRRRDAIAGDNGAAGERAARRGDGLSLAELKSRIANRHAGLVESIARRFQASGEPVEDLVQEGFLGLLSALESYDPSRGVKFSTYATHFIAGSIRHCLRDRGKIIKEPAWLHEVSSKINRATDALTQSLGRAPHTGEIAQALNLTEEAVEEILATRQTFQVAAFTTTDSDDNDGAVGLVDPEKIRSDKHVSLQLPIEDRIVLEGAVEKLKELEQKVLFEFFYKDLNQTEVARKFGISCNYVSHILKNSAKKLRRIMGEAEVRDRGLNGGGALVSVVTDPATGLYTSAHILARLDEEVSRAARASQTLAIVIVDLDGLPQAGARRDDAWAVCGAAVRGSIRRVDIAGRYEGNSLLTILPQTAAQATVVAERLLNVLLAAGASHGERFSARVGVAYYPEQSRTPRELIALARDAAQMPPPAGDLPVPIPRPEI